MTSYSRVLYEPYAVLTGKAIGPVSDYEEAATEALCEEAFRLQAISDTAYPTSEECAAAVAETECAVRFVRAERLT
jgi:hypothetical protein